MDEEKEVDAAVLEPEETAKERDVRLEKARVAEEENQERLRLISKANCARVQFTPATIKDIVSAHSSSILAKEGPIVALQPAMEAAARNAFAAAATPIPDKIDENGNTLLAISTRPTALAALLIRCEATPFTDEEQSAYLLRAIEALLKKEAAKCGGGGSSRSDAAAAVEFFEEGAFLAFVSQFYNPPYYYGERVRKLTGRGCLDDMMDVLARGCNVNTADGEGTTCLHYAAEFNRVDIIQVLADVFKPTLILNAKDKAGWTPLYNAVHYGNTDCISELLNRGAAVNGANKIGKTPLHCAAAQGRVEIAKLLLQNGADPCAQDSSGMTPLHEAAYKGQEETYILILANEATDASLRDKLQNLATDYRDISPVAQNLPLPTPPLGSARK